MAIMSESYRGVLVLNPFFSFFVFDLFLQFKRIKTIYFELFRVYRVRDKGETNKWFFSGASRHNDRTPEGRNGV